MQDNDESNAKPSILTEKLFLIIKWIFVLLLGLILFHTFQQKQQNFTNLYQEFYKIFSVSNILYLGIIFFLIFINWACEAKKWQVLSNNIEEINFIDAYKSVLVGLTLGFITPANLGDFAGRILHFKKSNHIVGIGRILLGNGIQFYVTIIFGIFAFLIIGTKKIPIFDQIIFGILIFSFFLGILFFNKREKIYTILKRFIRLEQYEVYFKAITLFEIKDFTIVLLWTILRFITYSLQFVILLQIFHFDIEFKDLWAISCLILLYKTLIPQVSFLSDLGVREISALHFFSFYSVNNSSVITATFTLWIINILFPVLIGSVFFFNYKNSNKSHQ